MVRKSIQPYFDQIMTSFLAANHVPQGDLVPLMRSVAAILDRLANPANGEASNGEASNILPPDALAPVTSSPAPEDDSWDGLQQRLREAYRVSVNG